MEAGSFSDFCCSIEVTYGGNQLLVLHTNQSYYAQVQGQMAVGERQWCDFVAYSSKGILVQWIPFDVQYWETKCLPNNGTSPFFTVRIFHRSVLSFCSMRQTFAREISDSGYT